MGARRMFPGLLAAALLLTAGGSSAELAARPRPEIVGPAEVRDSIDADLGAGVRSREAWLRDAYLAARDAGWWWARVRWNAGRLEVRPGPRARIGRLVLRGVDDGAQARFLEGSGLHEGRTVARRDWEHRLREGLTALGDDGYPFASVGIAETSVDSIQGRVDLVLALHLERQRRVARVEVHGAEHTRPDVLARLSGIEVGRWYRQESVDGAAEAWSTRGLVDAVEDFAVIPSTGEEGQESVDVQMAVRQPRSFGRASAALGVVRDAAGNSRVSGEVEIALRDLFGTAREFEGRWSDDGVQRRRLHMAFLEPQAFGLPFDLRLALGTQHEDDRYDRVDFSGGLTFLGRGGRRLDLHAQFERSTFAGETGRLRWRRRLGVTLGWRRSRPAANGFYGSLVSRVDAAQISERENIGASNETAARSSTQTLVDAHSALAFAWSRTVAWQLRAHWSSVEGADLPLPRGEQWTLGGARTVRGYREEQFQGERLAYGGSEWVLGPPDSGQAYVFSDVGWIRESFAAGEGIESRENWLFGFGVGLRSPTRAGALDLSIGFSERVSVDRGKLHLALTQQF